MRGRCAGTRTGPLFAESLLVMQSLLTVTVESKASPGYETRAQVADWKVWMKEEIPNPKVDIYRCGNEGRQARICDPDALLSPEEGQLLNAELEQLMSLSEDCHCPTHRYCIPGYRGWQVGLAIVHSIGLAINLTSGERDQIAEDYTTYMRKESWHFGHCEDDMLVLVVVRDKMVYTDVGDVMQKVLTTRCIRQIGASVRPQFADGDFGPGLVNMVKQYIQVLSSEHSCSQSSSRDIFTFTLIAIVAVAVLILTGLVLFLRSGSGGFGLRRWESHSCYRWLRCHAGKARKSGDKSGDYIAAFKAPDSPKSITKCSPTHSPSASDASTWQHRAGGCSVRT